MCFVEKHAIFLMTFIAHYLWQPTVSHHHRPKKSFFFFFCTADCLTSKLFGKSFNGIFSLIIYFFFLWVCFRATAVATGAYTMSRFNPPPGGLRKKLLKDGVISITMGDPKSSNGNSQTHENHGVHLLCFDLRRLSRTWQFVILTSATFAFFLLYGYMQVRLANSSCWCWTSVYTHH